jgi:hypothetical protein
MEAGCSHDALARAVVRVAAENGERALTNRSSIGHWLSGTKPAGRMPGYLTEALSRLTGRPIAPAGVGLAENLVSDVAGYCASRFRREQDRREMFGAAAELAYPAGWKCHDIGDEGLALAYYGRALQLATESDPVAHAAWTLRILAHQSLDLGQPRHRQALATKAWDLVCGRIEPAGEALRRHRRPGPCRERPAPPGRRGDRSRRTFAGRR